MDLQQARAWQQDSPGSTSTPVSSTPASGTPGSCYRTAGQATPATGQSRGWVTFSSNPLFAESPARALEFGSPPRTLDFGSPPPTPRVAGPASEQLVGNKEMAGGYEFDDVAGYRDRDRGIETFKGNKGVRGISPGKGE